MNFKEDSLKLSNLLKDHKDLSFELDRVKDLLSKKSDIANTKRLEDKFNHYTPISKFLTLENLVATQPPREKFDSLWSTVSSISESLPSLASISSLEESISSLNNDITERLSLMASKEDLEHDVKRMDFKLQRADKKLREDIKELRQLEGKIKEFALKLNGYVQAGDMNEKIKQVYKEFDKWWSYDHILKFKQEMEPRMLQSESLVADFNIEIIKIKKIVRRFDEVLLEKASKFSIDKIYEKFQNYLQDQDFSEFRENCKKFERRWDAELERIQKVVNENYEELNNTLGHAISDIAIDVERKILLNIKSKCIDREELQSNMCLKADREDIERLSNIKADKTETEENIVAMNLLFKQLEQCIIILVESLKNSIFIPNKSENNSQTQNDFLLKQASTLLKWLNSKSSAHSSLTNLLLGILLFTHRPFHLLSFHKNLSIPSPWL